MATADADAPPPATDPAEPADPPAASDGTPGLTPDGSAPRVKRSRWGSKKEESPADAGGAAADGKKRSRWGAKPTEVSDPLQLAVQLGLPLAALQNMSSEQQASLPRLKQRVDEIDLLLRLPDCGVSDIPEGARSPSPEPTYDQAGTRVNTREMRRRQQLLQQRQELMDSLKPKVGQRCWRKLIVPVDKYPGYNFFGAIIGPRGNAQKRMERESGCKIVIRGKGAIKDGCNRHDGKPLGPEDEEPMHVLIEGPDERTVERGQVLVEAVLNPYSDQAVQQKEKQMRELAIINGTLKEEDAAVVPVASWGNAAAKGALWRPPPPLAGALPMLGGPQHQHGGNGASMDDEYASFMAELDGGGGGAAPPARGRPDPAALALHAPWARAESEGGIGGGARPPMPPMGGPRPPMPPGGPPRPPMPPRGAQPPPPWASLGARPMPPPGPPPGGMPYGAPHGYPPMPPPHMMNGGPPPPPGYGGAPGYPPMPGYGPPMGFPPPPPGYGGHLGMGGMQLPHGMGGMGGMGMGGMGGMGGWLPQQLELGELPPPPPPPDEAPPPPPPG